MTAPAADAGEGPFVAVVILPLGAVRVRVDRRAMGLGERGGFEAAWAGAAARETALTREAFRLRVRDHLAGAFRAAEGGEPPRVLLNLAAHRLVDDVEGWTHLNATGGW